MDVPVALRDVGLNTAVVFAGRPVTLSVTVPLNPAAALRFTAKDVLEAAATVRKAGVEEMEKLSVTVAVRLADWESAPLAQVIVKGLGPAGAAVEVSVKPMFPLVERLAGVKLATMVPGNPPALHVTGSAKPLLIVMATVPETVPVTPNTSGVAVAAMEKLPTETVIATVC